MHASMILAFGALFAGPALLAAQTAQPREPEPAWNSRPRVEVIGNFAIGHLFRFDDRGYGTGFNAGAGVEIAVWRGLRAGAEFNRTFGLEPSPAQCGSISPGPGEPPFPCTGSSRNGLGAASAASFTAAYYFGTGRVQPYVLGGISLLRTEEYDTTSIVEADHVEFRENFSKDTGVGPTIGAGLRACLTRNLSIRPEFRFSDGTALSRNNLSQFRFSLGIAYAW